MLQREIGDIPSSGGISTRSLSASSASRFSHCGVLAVLRPISLLRLLDSTFSRKFPMGLGMPPLQLKIVLESNPLKSRRIPASALRELRTLVCLARCGGVYTKVHIPFMRYILAPYHSVVVNSVPCSIPVCEAFTNATYTHCSMPVCDAHITQRRDTCMHVYVIHCSVYTHTCTYMYMYMYV